MNRLFPLRFHQRFQSYAELLPSVYCRLWCVLGFLGSAAIALLYDLSLPLMIAFFVAAVLAAVPIFIWVGRHANVVNYA
jgi:cyanate permease